MEVHDYTVLHIINRFFNLADGVGVSTTTQGNLVPSIELEPASPVTID